MVVIASAKVDAKKSTWWRRELLSSARVNKGKKRERGNLSRCWCRSMDAAGPHPVLYIIGSYLECGWRVVMDDAAVRTTCSCMEQSPDIHEILNDTCMLDTRMFDEGRLSWRYNDRKSFNWDGTFFFGNKMIMALFSFSTFCSLQRWSFCEMAIMLYLIIS